MKNIGKKIRILREIAGLKQGELASRLNVSSNYVSLIENQKKDPSLKFIKKLAVEFEIPISVFFWDDIETNRVKDQSLRESAEKINNLFWDLIKSKFIQSEN